MKFLRESTKTIGSNQGRINRSKLANITGLPINNILMTNGGDKFEIMNLSENEYHLVYNKLKADKSISQLSSSHRLDYKHMNYITKEVKTKYTIYGTIN